MPWNERPLKDLAPGQTGWVRGRVERTVTQHHRPGESAEAAVVIVGLPGWLEERNEPTGHTLEITRDAEGYLRLGDGMPVVAVTTPWEHRQRNGDQQQQIG